jgi:hypothetical protein
MNSPFPGMDPYLEEPARWGGVHSRLINSISDLLTRLVSPRFFVEIEEKVYITGEDRDDERWVVPDVYLAARPLVSHPSTVSAPVITEPTLIEPLDYEEVRDRHIEIYDAESRAVVTIVEVLSPFNKAAGAAGRRAFMWKRKTVMASDVHWMEIDLLRAGERPNEVRGQSDYYALLKRGNTTRPYAVWLFDLRDALPTLAVPLRPPFEDVPLELRLALEDVYTRGDYVSKIDYSRLPPPPRLRPADEAWAKERVSAWLAARAT